MTDPEPRGPMVPAPGGEGAHGAGTHGPGGEESGAPVPEVKICGLTRRVDAELAARAGAGYLGVVLVKGTPRALSVSQGREITQGLGVPVVAVLANPSLVEAMAWGRELGASVLQLHGEESPELVSSLKEEGPWRVWKALRVRDREALAGDLSRYSGLVDGILLDSWHPKRRGGTGTAFSWADGEAIRGRIPPGVDLIAAGGLDPGNVGEAIRRLRPQVVDVSSGVEESPGIKREAAVVAFIRAAHGTGKEKW